MIELPHNCEIFYTKDGSPTLNLKGPDGYAEKMHHSGGALSESLYVYRQGLTEVVARGWTPTVLSLGLGLGYNELITISELRKNELHDFTIYSFETVKQLREGFAAWAGGGTGGKLAFVLDQVCKQVARAQNLPAALLKIWLREAFEESALHLRGSFPEDCVQMPPINLVYFDAFSKKMSPELWVEERLIEQLNRLLANNCIFTSYASMSALNRALEQLNFRRTKKTGFSGRRESTLAIREPIR